MWSSMASRFGAAFRRSLQKQPLLTNTAVYASFYTAAELSQQAFNKYNSPVPVDIDYASAARIVTVGSALYAPSLYYWYKYLDKKFVGKSTKIVLTKVCYDSFVMTPILLALFFTILGALEHREDIFEELRNKFKKTYMANLSFWFPAQTVNFFFMPPHMRVVYVSSMSFIWINILCFIKRQKTEKTT